MKFFQVVMLIVVVIAAIAESDMNRGGYTALMGTAGHCF